MNEDCTCVEEVLVVENPISTQTVPEDGENITVNIDDVFSLDDTEIEIRPVPIPSSPEDPDSGEESPTDEPGATPDPNSDPDSDPSSEPINELPVGEPGATPGSGPDPVNELPVAEAEIVDGQIIIDPVSDRDGIQEFEVIATTPDGQTAKDTFAVVVTPVDDPLTLKEEIPDVDFVANQNMISIKVDDFFADPDTDADISLSIKSNTNSELIAATLDGDNLIVESDLTAPGSTDITIEATSNGETIEDTFTVNVDENICIKDGTEAEQPLLDTTLDTVDVVGFDHSRGSRLYTASAKEIEFLTGNEADNLQPSDSSYRGLTGAEEGVTAVTRFYNQNTDTHFYSTDQKEIDFIDNLDNYRNEGVDHYAYSSDSINPEAVPLYRFYDQSSNSHLFTLDQSEGSDLSSEGIAYHVLPELV